MSVTLNVQSLSNDNSPHPDVTKIITDHNIQFNMLKGINNDLSVIKTKMNIKSLPIKPIIDDEEKLRKYQNELNDAIRENETTIDARLKALETKMDKIIIMLKEIKNINTDK